MNKILTLLILSGLVPGALLAEPLVLEPIVVQAEKTLMPMQEVPVSLSVVGEQQLIAGEVRTLAEVGRITPNLHVINEYGGGRMNLLFIRGLGTSINEPCVGFLVDGVGYMRDTSLDLDLFEVERIEILRGPQGTLYGRNTLAGVVHVITAPPQPNPELHVRTGIGFEGQQELAASLQGAIVPDRLMAKITGSYHQDPGEIDNTFLDKPGDEQDEKSSRLDLWITPDLPYETRLTVDRAVVDNGGFLLESRANAEASPFEVELSEDTFARRNSTGITWNQTFHGEGFQVESITGVRWENNVALSDPDLSPAKILTMRVEDDNHALSEELRIHSTNEKNTWQWLAGLYLYEERGDKQAQNSYGVDAVALGLVPMPAHLRMSHEVSGQGYALFGQVSWKPFDRLTVTGGLRYEKEQKDLDQKSWIEAAGLVIPRTTAERGLADGEWLPKLTLAYQWTPDLNVYGSVTKGYRSGGFNFFYSTPEDAEFEAEHSWNYEVGVKSSWWQDRLTLNAALFYIDWQDQQVEQFLPGFIQYFENAGQSTSQGVELEADWHPDDTWQMHLGYGWTDARFDQYVDTLTGANHAGNRIPYVPAHTVDVAVQYRREIAEATDWTVRAEWQGRGDFYWDSANTLRQPFYGLVNLRTAIAWEGWEWSLWAKNLFDKRYETFGARDVMVGEGVHTGAPLTVGTTLDFRY